MKSVLMGFFFFMFEDERTLTFGRPLVLGSIETFSVVNLGKRLAGLEACCCYGCP